MVRLTEEAHADPEVGLSDLSRKLWGSGCLECGLQEECRLQVGISPWPPEFHWGEAQPVKGQSRNFQVAGPREVSPVD